MELRNVRVRKWLNELVQVVLVLRYVVSKSSGARLVVSFSLAVPLRLLGDDWNSFRIEDGAHVTEEL